MHNDLLLRTVSNLIGIRKQLLSPDEVAYTAAVMRMDDLIRDLRQAQRSQNSSPLKPRFTPRTLTSMSVVRDD